jgi:hypothetical protein
MKKGDHDLELYSDGRQFESLSLYWLPWLKFVLDLLFK